MDYSLEVCVIIFCGVLNIIAYYWDNPRIDDE